MGQSSVKNCRVFQIDVEELKQRSARAFRAFAGPAPGAAKRIAAAIRCSERTARNYLDGTNLPSSIHDIRALRFIPPYAAMKNEVAEIETSLHPLFEQKLMELVRIVQQHGEPIFGGSDV